MIYGMLTFDNCPAFVCVRELLRPIKHDYRTRSIVVAERRTQVIAIGD